MPTETLLGQHKPRCQPRGRLASVSNPSCQRGRFPAGEITRGFAPLALKPHLPREQRPCWLHLYQQRMCTRVPKQDGRVPKQPVEGKVAASEGGNAGLATVGAPQEQLGSSRGSTAAWHGEEEVIRGQKGARCAAGGTSGLTRGLVKAREETGQVLPYRDI